MTAITTPRLGVLTTTVLVVAALAGGPFAVIAQDDGVVTPTPSGDEDDPYDCADFDNRQQIEEVFDRTDDESNLDADDDGVACEHIGDTQSAQTATSTVTSTPTATATATSTPTATATDTATPTNTATPSDTATPTDTTTPEDEETAENTSEETGESTDCPNDGED